MQDPAKTTPSKVHAWLGGPPYRASGPPKRSSHTDQLITYSGLGSADREL
jgi:hypothetical protein